MNDTILQINDVILQGEITKHMKTTIPVYAFDEIDSTNQFAKTLADECALVVADRQSAGKGRLGRRFFSPMGTGVYLSLKAKVSNLYQNVPFVTTLSSVAVHKAIKTLYNIDCGIKWVNDIYLGKKKVAGILCEAIDDAHAIIGIGINVYPTSFPEDLKDTATYITNHQCSVTRNKLIALVCDNLFSLLNALPDTTFMEYYKAHSIVIGKSILCIQQTNTFPATAIDITDTGALIVQADDTIHTLSTGEISIRFTN